MLKNFRRVNVLQKYFNMKILQQSREERMEKATAMEKFFSKRNCIRGYHVYKAVWTATVGEVLVCESPKTLLIDTLWL